jgi:hypothetical protein
MQFEYSVAESSNGPRHVAIVLGPGEARDFSQVVKDGIHATRLEAYGQVLFAAANLVAGRTETARALWRTARQAGALASQASLHNRELQRQPGDRYGLRIEGVTGDRLYDMYREGVIFHDPDDAKTLLPRLPAMDKQ